MSAAAGRRISPGQGDLTGHPAAPLGRGHAGIGFGRAPRCVKGRGGPRLTGRGSRLDPLQFRDTRDERGLRGALIHSRQFIDIEHTCERYSEGCDKSWRTPLAFGYGAHDGLPLMSDKPTGRVVAVIVLLILVAAALRGYFPGARPGVATRSRAAVGRG